MGDRVDTKQVTKQRDDQNQKGSQSYDVEAVQDDNTSKGNQSYDKEGE